ncbi:hypothetical protein ACFLU5_12330 [Bacteroidota bacterium]
MYNIFLFLHSWLRWLALVLLLVASIRAIYGLIEKKTFTNKDDKITLVAVSLLHLQLLFGVILYSILSPLTKAAFSNFSAAMKDGLLRYWAVEHIFVMLLSVAIAQIGRIMIKRSKTDTAKFKNELIYFLFAFILIISRIPWDEPVRMLRGIIE